MKSTKKNINGIFFEADPFWILNYSMGENMNISDVIIRYLAIENYYGKNNNGFELYNEMQKTRVKTNKKVPKYRDDNGIRFKKLIESFDKKGYDYKYPIQLNSQFALFDGAHRLALALYHNMSSVPVYIDFTEKETPNYSLEWFKDNEMSNYVDIICKKYKNIIEKLSDKYILMVNKKDTKIEDYFYDNKIEYKDKYKDYRNIYIIYDLNLDTKTKYSCGKIKEINFLKQKIEKISEKKKIDFVFIGGGNEE